MRAGSGLVIAEKEEEEEEEDEALRATGLI